MQPSDRATKLQSHGLAGFYSRLREIHVCLHLGKGVSWPLSHSTWTRRNIANWMSEDARGHARAMCFGKTRGRSAGGGSWVKILGLAKP